MESIREGICGWGFFQESRTIHENSRSGQIANAAAELFQWFRYPAPGRRRERSAIDGGAWQSYVPSSIDLVRENIALLFQQGI